MQTPLRVVLYTRVSTEDQAEDGTGLETQKLESARYAESIGASVVAVESDPGVSGTIYPRPGLERALHLLESNQADAIIAHRVDRLGREAHIPLLVFKRIQAAGARLFTVVDGEATRKNILLFAVRCGMAETDYTSILDNLKNGKRRMAESGRVPNRALSPYGYHIVQKVENGTVKEDAGTYVVVEKEAEVVRTIFTRYAAGDTLGRICRYLHEQGIPIPRPDKASVSRSFWQPTMVSRILKNTAYKGYVLWGKTITTFKDKSSLSFDERLNCRKPGGAKKVVTTTPQAQQVRISVPPIVSPDVWEACQRQREANKAVGGIRNDRKHLFASLVICPNCERRMNSGHVNYQKRPTHLRPIIYRCRDHARSQNAADYVCHKPVYKEKDIRDALRRFFLALVETPEFVVTAFQAYQQSRRSRYNQEEHMEVINALRDLDAREAATAEGYTRAIQLGARQEVFEKLLTDIVLERKRLQERKVAMEAALTSDQTENAQEVAEVIADYARDILEILDSETLEPLEVNTRLRRVLQEIRPTQDGFRIVARSMSHVHIHEAPVTGIVTPVR